MERLAQVFQAHREGGIDLSQDPKEIDYLGHILSGEGVAMQANYIACIMEWPAPQNHKELNILLGFLGYHQRFIPEFSLLTTKMNAQKTTQLKDKFTAAPIRA